MLNKGAIEMKGEKQIPVAIYGSSLFLTAVSTMFIQDGVLGVKEQKPTLSLNQIAVAASQTMQHHPRYKNENGHSG